MAKQFKKDQNQPNLFLGRQRKALEGLIQDQLGPAAQLDEIVTGKPPLEDEKSPIRQYRLKNRK